MDHDKGMSAAGKECHILLWVALWTDIHFLTLAGFADLRTKGKAQWQEKMIFSQHLLHNDISSACRFVDGKDYMEAVADAILSAKKEIYITDWQ